jgi:hypothetical protein
MSLISRFNRGVSSALAYLTGLDRLPKLGPLELHNGRGQVIHLVHYDSKEAAPALIQLVRQNDEAALQRRFNLGANTPEAQAELRVLQDIRSMVDRSKGDEGLALEVVRDMWMSGGPCFSNITSDDHRAIERLMDKVDGTDLRQKAVQRDILEFESKQKKK